LRCCSNDDAGRRLGHERADHHLGRLEDEGLVHLLDLLGGDDDGDLAVALDLERLLVTGFGGHGVRVRT
jgi:hypothetical protein